MIASIALITVMSLAVRLAYTLRPTHGSGLAMRDPAHHTQHGPPQRSNVQ